MAAHRAPLVERPQWSNRQRRAQGARSSDDGADLFPVAQHVANRAVGTVGGLLHGFLIGGSKYVFPLDDEASELRQLVDAIQFQANASPTHRSRRASSGARCSSSQKFPSAAPHTSLLDV